MPRRNESAQRIAVLMCFLAGPACTFDPLGAAARDASSTVFDAGAGDALAADALEDAAIADVEPGDLGEAPDVEPADVKEADVEPGDAPVEDADGGVEEPDAGRDAGLVDSGNVGDAGTPFTAYVPSNFDPAIFSAPYANLIVAPLATCTVEANDPPVFGAGCALLPPVRSAIVTLSDGKPALVVPVGDLTVLLQGTLRIEGTLPVIFAVFGEADISGIVEAGASGSTGGPGNSDSCTLGQGDNGAIAGSRGSGGGGGGFGLPGANGGDGQNAAGGVGGLAESGVELLVPLRGGCSGGSGPGNNGGAGGAGGGALQISASGSLRVTGRINAGGGGGRGGRVQRGGAGGGGSGGAVLLEAAALEITGTATIALPGGAGGEGADNNGNGDSGDNANELGRTLARGGRSNPPAGGEGGDGASAQTGAELGTSSNEGGGGGGGGVGRIRLHSGVSCVPRSGSRLVGVLRIDCP